MYALKKYFFLPFDHNHPVFIVCSLKEPADKRGQWHLFCHGCSALLHKKVSLVHIIMAQETSVSNFEMVRTSHFPHIIMLDLGAFPHPYRVK